MNLKKQAFTLVELIVVITILTILWTIAFISLQWYSKHARNGARITDIKNTENVLEFFALKTGKYPLPWNSSDITASWWTVILWKSWNMDTTVQTQVERLSKLPLDPKTGETMKYATTLSRKEYELKYDFELAQNNITNTSYAESTSPYVKWTYNWLYLLADNGSYYGVPWLHTSAEDLDTAVDFELNDKIVNYQVVQLTNSWVILTSNNIKDNYENFALALKTAYSTTSELNDEIYAVVASLDSSTARNFAETIITGKVSDYVAPENGICGSDNSWSFITTPTNLCVTWTQTSVTDGWEWSNYTWTCDGLNWWENNACSAFHEYANYPWCDTDDITVPAANWYWPFTISACNLWTNIAWTTASSYWGHFQFGRNVSYEDGTWTNSNSSWSYDWKSPGWTNAWSANDWWVVNSSTATYSSSDPSNQTKMQWPCVTWYHIPAYTEWSGVVIAWWWQNNGAAIRSTLKLPLNGYRQHWNAYLASTEIIGFYASASPASLNGYVLRVSTQSAVSAIHSIERPTGSAIRCFKN